MGKKKQVLTEEQKLKRLEYKRKWYATRKDDPSFKEKARQRRQRRQEKQCEYMKNYYITKKDDPVFKQKQRTYTAEHKSEKREYAAKYRADPKNHTKLQANAKKQHKKRRADIAKRLREYKKGAAERGLEFTISDECATALLLGNCAYCGKMDEGTNGIDRCDNTKGYIPGNCLSCCSRCNFAKRAMTGQAFLAMCYDVVAHGSTLVARPTVVSRSEYSASAIEV
jgi:hypothetical protein